MGIDWVLNTRMLVKHIVNDTSTSLDSSACRINRMLRIYEITLTDIIDDEFDKAILMEMLWEVGLFVLS